MTTMEKRHANRDIAFEIFLVELDTSIYFHRLPITA